MYQAKEDGRNLIRTWKEKTGWADGTVDLMGVLALKKKFDLLSDRMRGVFMEYANALVEDVDARNPFTKEHSRNVSAASATMARAIGLIESDVEIIRCAGLLHDVGKITVSRDILAKKGPLTPEEFEVIKKHPVTGVNILKDIRFLEKEIPIILHHHERHDGKGYPHGLKGPELPVGARISPWRTRLMP